MPAEFDVVVCGGGMAGLVAGATAAEHGARVLVAEKSASLGGSAALSAGICWTVPSVAVYRARVPSGDPELGRVLVGDFRAGIAWVRAAGVEVAPESHGHMGYGSGHQIDVHGLFARLRARIESGGGSLVLRTAVRGLLLGASGRGVRGVVLADLGETPGAEGLHEVEAGAVVLATGGFQGDPELVSRFLGPGADDMLVRANRGSVGDGFRMGLAAGAGASRGLGAFYGHLLPVPIADYGERHYLPLTQYHSNRCLLVNRLGRRFMDESRGDEHAVQEVLRQPGARAFLLADERQRLDHVVTAPYPGGGVVDRFAEAVAAGARLLTADRLDGLVALLAAEGVPAGNLRATLADYERAARGQDAPLDAPLPATPTPLRDPPFHALEVQPALTFPHGGLRVDPETRVLDRDGCPLAGLHAAGADAGGVHNVGYAGGLATALVFGRRAGAAAAAAATALQETRVGHQVGS